MKTIKKLNMLGMLYYVFAGLGILASLTPVILIKTSTTEFKTNVIFLLFLGLGLVAIYLIMGCIALVGYALRRRRWWNFCYVMSALLCPSFPFGTALGIASLITLSKPEVKNLFTPNQQNQPIDGKPVSG
jgi:hypothetical protein